MAAERALIVNADDFGRSHGINRGVVRAHEHGVVTSASLMVRWPAAAAAAAYSKARPELSVGLHLDLGEWVYRDGHWQEHYEVVPTSNPEAVTAEVTRQLEDFHRLLGRDPTHLDSHQHVHCQEPAASIVDQAGRRLGVPVRNRTPQVRHCGDFYGQTGKGDPWPEGISVANLLAVLAALPSAVTELGCHPGLDEDYDSVYRDERRREVEVLCDPRVRAALHRHGIELRSFAASR